MLTLVSCDKDDDGDNVSPNVALLTAGEWQGSAVYRNGEDNTSEFEELNHIDWNNHSAIFKRDGSYAQYYEDNALIEGMWAFENDEQVIVFDKGTDDEYSIIISKLDEDEFFYVQSGVEFRLVR